MEYKGSYKYSNIKKRRTSDKIFQRPQSLKRGCGLQTRVGTRHEDEISGRYYEVISRQWCVSSKVLGILQWGVVDYGARGKRETEAQGRSDRVK